MRRIQGLIRLATLLPVAAALLVPSQPVAAATADTGSATSDALAAADQAKWSQTQIAHYKTKLNDLAVVEAWSAGVFPVTTVVNSDGTTTSVQNCGNDQCPPAEVTIQEDAAIQADQSWCGPTSSHNVLYTFYFNGSMPGGTGATPSPATMASVEHTGQDGDAGTYRYRVPEGLNAYQNTNTYSLGNLGSGASVWDYGVTDLWRGYGSIWNIGSYDSVTKQHPLSWYPNVNIKHYFASYAYKTSNHLLYIFDENPALNPNYWQGVDPGSLYNASVANNREVNPQVIW